MDKMVLGNGAYALGNLAACSVGLKDMIAESSGTETILGTMRLHESDNILQANCCLAVSKSCRVPALSVDEDYATALKILEKASAIQEEALQLGAFRTILRSLALHPSDAVLRRTFCEAAQALAEGNSLLCTDMLPEGEQEDQSREVLPAEAGGHDEVPDEEDPKSWRLERLVKRITTMMGQDVHAIEYERGNRQVPVEEQHGRDEMVAAYASRALGQIVLARSEHKMAGLDGRFPMLVPDPDKQTVVGQVGGVQQMCDAIKQFPKKRDTVLRFTIAAMANVIRCHEGNQRLLDRHKGIDLLTASMSKWSEDKRHVALILLTLRVMLEGSDGRRNNWYLDTYRGKTMAKMVVKMYTTEAIDSGVQTKIVEAQEMARTWLPERKAQDAVLN